MQVPHLLAKTQGGKFRYRCLLFSPCLCQVLPCPHPVINLKARIQGRGLHIEQDWKGTVNTYLFLQGLAERRDLSCTEWEVSSSDPSRFLFLSGTCWGWPACLDFEVHGTSWFLKTHSFVWFRRTPLQFYLSVSYFQWRPYLTQPTSQRIPRAVTNFSRCVLDWGSGGTFYWSTNISLWIVSLNSSPPTHSYSDILSKNENQLPHIILSSSRCWLMLKVDSLGETMKEIKVYLLNGLTCRR